MGMELSCAFPPSTAVGGQLSVPFLFGGENQRKCHRCHRSFSRPCNHRLPIIFASAGAQTEPIIVIIIYLYSLNLLLSSNRPARRRGGPTTGCCSTSTSRGGAPCAPSRASPSTTGARIYRLKHRCLDNRKSDKYTLLLMNIDVDQNQSWF